MGMTISTQLVSSPFEHIISYVEESLLFRRLAMQCQLPQQHMQRKRVNSEAITLTTNPSMSYMPPILLPSSAQWLPGITCFILTSTNKDGGSSVFIFIIL